MKVITEKGFDKGQFGLLVRVHFLPRRQLKLIGTDSLREAPWNFHLELCVAWFWIDIDLRGAYRD